MRTSRTYGRAPRRSRARSWPIRMGSVTLRGGKGAVTQAHAGRAQGVGERNSFKNKAEEGVSGEKAGAAAPGAPVSARVSACVRAEGAALGVRVGGRKPPDMQGSQATTYGRERRERQCQSRLPWSGHTQRDVLQHPGPAAVQSRVLSQYPGTEREDSAWEGQQPRCPSAPAHQHQLRCSVPLHKLWPEEGLGTWLENCALSPSGTGWLFSGSECDQSSGAFSEPSVKDKPARVPSWWSLWLQEGPFGSQGWTHGERKEKARGGRGVGRARGCNRGHTILPERGGCS